MGIFKWFNEKVCDYCKKVGDKRDMVRNYMVICDGYECPEYFFHKECYKEWKSKC